MKTPNIIERPFTKKDLEVLKSKGTWGTAFGYIFTIAFGFICIYLIKKEEDTLLIFISGFLFLLFLAASIYTIIKRPVKKDLREKTKLITTLKITAKKIERDTNYTHYTEIDEDNYNDDIHYKYILYFEENPLLKRYNVLEESFHQVAEGDSVTVELSKHSGILLKISCNNIDIEHPELFTKNNIEKGRKKYLKEKSTTFTKFFIACLCSSFLFIASPFLVIDSIEKYEALRYYDEYVKIQVKIDDIVVHGKPGEIENLHHGVTLRYLNKKDSVFLPEFNDLEYTPEMQRDTFEIYEDYSNRRIPFYVTDNDSIEVWHHPTQEDMYITSANSTLDTSGFALIIIGKLILLVLFFYSAWYAFSAFKKLNNLSETST